MATTINDAEVRRLARVIRQRAGVKTGESVPMLTLARRLCSVVLHDMKGSRGALMPYDDAKGGWIIAVEPDDPEQDHVIGHLLGKWLTGSTCDANADGIGHALLALNGRSSARVVA